MTKIHGALAVALLASGGVFWAACGDDDAVNEPTVVPDGGNKNPNDSGGNTTDGGGGDSGPADCFTDPKTAFEIINACTDAQKITKNPTLPLLQADGGLPTLPQ